MRLETHSGLWKQGVLVGISAVMLGDFIFAMIYPIALGIVSGFQIRYFFILFLTVAVISGITGFLVSIIPGGIGGFCLALVLQQEAVKKHLTVKKATLMGALIGGLAGIIACLISLLFIFGSLKSNSVFSYGIYDNGGLITFVKLALITILPVAIAIFMGTWSGRRLARQFSIESQSE